MGFRVSPGQRKAKSPTSVKKKKSSKRNMRFSGVEKANRTVLSPKQARISNVLVNKHNFIKKVMKGVLSPKRTSYLQQNRYFSPQPSDIRYINAPNFQSDRGRRKISKLGGTKGSFLSENSSQKSS